jgi:DNA-binding Xre family transcriptional regulator
MNRTDLKDAAGIGTTTLSKLGKEPVSMGWEKRGS